MGLRRLGGGETTVEKALDVWAIDNPITTDNNLAIVFLTKKKEEKNDTQVDTFYPRLSPFFYSAANKPTSGTLPVPTLLAHACTQVHRFSEPKLTQYA